MFGVVLEKVSKRYPGGALALDGIDLRVHGGELLVVVGPSGCGKTTLLRVVAGLEEASSGTVSIGGETVNRVPPEKRDVALIFQTPSLYPHLNVFKNLAFGLRVRRLSRAETTRRVYRIAETLGIRELLERRPETLSGGQMQRVALGRALVREPRVFLLDEPLSSLDARLRHRMRQEIKRLHREFPTTTIHVTHDQEEALSLADRIAILEEGRIQQVGCASEVYRQPANLFVAGFLGNPPMNLLRGRIRREGEGVAFEIAGTRLPLPEALSRTPRLEDGRSLVLGIRPEHIRQRPLERTGEAAIPMEARISMVEPQGDRTVVMLAIADGQQIATRLASGAPPREGEDSAAYLDMSQAHLFDPENGGQRMAAD